MPLKSVLFVCSVYKPHIGGVETSIEEITKVLAKNNIKSIVLTKRFPFELEEVEVVGSAPTYRFFRPHTDIDFQKTLDWLMKKNELLKVDIVHIIGVRRPMPLFGLLLSKMWRVPFIVTFAGGDLPDGDDPTLLSLWGEGKDTVPLALKQADEWAVYSNYTSSLVKAALNDSRPMRVIYGGINLKEVKQVSPYRCKRPYFFIACRLEYSKGVDLLIDAFCLVSKTLPNQDLFVAGDGSARNALEKKVSKLSIKNRVHFLGKIDRPTIFSYMKGADAHICPSRKESGGGLVNYEAQAAGCLAIGSTAGGIPEYIISGETGLLFKEGSISDLAKKLLLAVSNDEKIKEIKKNSINISVQHDWSEFVNNYLQLYDKMISEYTFKPFVPWSPITKILAQKIRNYNE